MMEKSQKANRVLASIPPKEYKRLHAHLELVDLKFFAGLTFAEIAALRGGSERTAQRDWDKARALLHGLMQG